MVSFFELDGSRTWRTKEIKWSAEGSIGRSGGNLTYWDERKFTCLRTWSLGGDVVVNGWWNATREEFCVINVYASCRREEKMKLWDRLDLVVSQMVNVKLCIIGDFNSIIAAEQRVGSGWRISSREIHEFKLFVVVNRLVDVGLQGRKFTWYNCSGSCKSLLDRALINEKWLENWNETRLRGLPRSISDHCAIILHSTQSD